MLRLLRSLASASAAALGLAAAAQTFPNRPITVICAYPPGASADTALRALAQAASRELGQTIVVDNKPGAAGTMAALTVLGAKPDGYTLAQTTPILMRQAFITKVPYDPARDFSYIMSPTAFELGLAVRADAPWRTLDDLVAYARRNPGKATYATVGVGTTQHMVMERIAQARGVTWTHSPYKGSAPALADLQGGHIDAVSDTSSWAALTDAGKIRLLAVYGPQRLKRWPDVPTLREMGLDIAESAPWGLIGPTGIPTPVIKTLQDAFRKAMDDPGFQAALATLGQEPRYMDSATYRDFMRNRIPIEREIVEKFKLRQN